MQQKAIALLKYGDRFLLSNLKQPVAFNYLKLFKLKLHLTLKSYIQKAHQQNWYPRCRFLLPLL